MRRPAGAKPFRVTVIVKERHKDFPKEWFDADALESKERDFDTKLLIPRTSKSDSYLQSGCWWLKWVGLTLDKERLEGRLVNEEIHRKIEALGFPGPRTCTLCSGPTWKLACKPVAPSSGLPLNAKTHSVCLGEAWKSRTNNHIKGVAKSAGINKLELMPSKRLLNRPVERRPGEQADTAMADIVQTVLASVYGHAAREMKESENNEQSNDECASDTEYCYRCKKEEVQMCLVCDNKECKVLPFDSDDFWGEQRGVHWLGERCIEFMVCNNCGQSMFRCPYCDAITKHALHESVTADLGAVLSAEPTVWTFNNKTA